MPTDLLGRPIHKDDFIALPRPDTAKNATQVIAIVVQEDPVVVMFLKGDSTYIRSVEYPEYTVKLSYFSVPDDVREELTGVANVVQ